jgi:SAM-dependent methyltransferase
MPDVEARARMSLGGSERAIYEMVSRCLLARNISGGTFVDVGCGSGQLYSYVGERFNRYVGIDVVQYENLRPEIDFRLHDLDAGRLPVPADMADVAAAVETIEHMENPRLLFRELVRVTKPGGWVLVTTPNQLSFLSLLTLLCKQRFNAFQDVHYPAHITALLPVDLQRIAGECNLQNANVEYSHCGRIALTKHHYPAFLARLLPAICSDNLLLLGRKGGL